MLASVNEIVIAQADEALSEDQLRQRAYSELLRQRASSSVCWPPTTRRPSRA